MAATGDGAAAKAVAREVIRVGALLNQAALAATTAIEENWSATFFGLDQEQRFVLLIICVVGIPVLLIAIAGIISGTISAVHRRRMDADMKQDMLDRGMSSEEIARVIEASPPRDWLERWAARKRS